MSLPIQVADSNNNTAAGAPLARGVYACRIVKYQAGALIGFDCSDTKALRTIYGTLAYMSEEPFEVFTAAGQVVIEFITDKRFKHAFNGASGSASGLLDNNGRQIVVGIIPANSPTTSSTGGAPVQIAGVDYSTGQGTGLVLPIPVIGDQSTPAVNVGVPVSAMRTNGKVTNLRSDANNNLLQARGVDARNRYIVSCDQLKGPSANGLGPVFSLENPAASGVTVYIDRVELNHPGLATAAAYGRLTLQRLTGVSTGGSVVTLGALASRAPPSSSILKVPAGTGGLTLVAYEVYRRFWAFAAGAEGSYTQQELIGPEDVIEIAPGEAFLLNIDTSPGAGWTGIGANVHLFEK